MKHIFTLITCGLLLCLGAGAAEADGKHVAVPATIDSFFTSYCYDCHDSETQKGDFSLEI